MALQVYFISMFLFCVWVLHYTIFSMFRLEILCIESGFKKKIYAYCWVSLCVCVYAWKSAKEKKLEERKYEIPKKDYKPQMGNMM